MLEIPFENFAGHSSSKAEERKNPNTRSDMHNAK